MYNSTWYKNLIQPPFNPPNSIFMPVWSIIYITIFVSLLTYIFTKSTISKKNGYIFFIIQLILNFLWSPTFFYLKNIGIALIVIIFLDIFVIMTARKFYSVSKLAGITLIPYLLWILFATYLNIGYFVLN